MNRLYTHISLVLFLSFIAPLFVISEQNLEAATTDSSTQASKCDNPPEGGGGKYFGKVCACIAARKAGTAKTLKNPICPEGKMNEEDVAYRVILDMEFSDIDKKVYSDLKSFQSQRGKDFTKMSNQIKDMFDATAATPKYPDSYDTVCRAFGDGKNPLNAGVTTFWSMSTDAMSENSQRCRALTAKKLQAFKSMGKLIAMRNISKSQENDRKEYMLALRDEYVQFFRKWDSYIAGLGRIKDKWNVKVKNPL